MLIDTATNKKEGICAQVRVQIQQELALTREAFAASLVLINDDTVPLINITVCIRITRVDDPSKADKTLFFVIGDPNPVIQGGVNGSGFIAAASRGTTEWLLMALHEAAPKTLVTYSVGGTITYVSNNALSTIELIPDTITVHPDPSLQIKYFWEVIFCAVYNV